MTELAENGRGFMDEQEFKGADVDVKFEGGKAVVTVEHVGKIGGAKIEAYVKADVLIGKALDELEKLIPGDQTAIVAAAKAALAAVKF